LGDPNPKLGVQSSTKVQITFACTYIFCWFSGEYFPKQPSQEFGLCPIPSTWPIWIIVVKAEKLATCSLGLLFRIKELGRA
jgi:TRAP-type C4-dicarboxylate transport system permease small subunit